MIENRVAWVQGRVCPCIAGIEAVGDGSDLAGATVTIQPPFPSRPSRAVAPDETVFKVCGGDRAILGMLGVGGADLDKVAKWFIMAALPSNESIAYEPGSSALDLTWPQELFDTYLTAMDDDDVSPRVMNEFRASFNAHRNQGPMTPEEFREIRIKHFGEDMVQFAAFLRYKDMRTLRRMETGQSEPSGPITRIMEWLRDGVVTPDDT